jgi:hypothetical protein
MIVFLFVCLIANVLNLTEGTFVQEIGWLSFIAGHMTHATLVVAGVVISLLFFEGTLSEKVNWKVIGFALLFFFNGILVKALL